jgi:anti-sigma factor RsiW
MNIEEARKLIDLFLDDDLPMELASEFKQAMFESPELRAEVASLRQSREALWLAYEGDSMSEDERCRVLSRIVAESAGLRDTNEFAVSPGQLRLPLQKEA